MNPGRISESIYRRSIIKKCNIQQKNIKSAIGIGLDGALLSGREGAEQVFTSASLSGVEEKIGWLTGNRFLNRMAAMGGNPVAAWLSLFIPCWFSEAGIKAVMEEVNSLGADCGMSIAGCRVEASENILQPAFTIAGIGYRESEFLPEQENVSGKRRGEDIVMCGYAGTETALILSWGCGDELSSRYNEIFIDGAKKMMRYMRMVPEAAVAVSHGVKAMHVIEDGGVFGALWELLEAAGAGAEVDIKAIPIRQETVEICSFFDINPYQVPASGLLIRTEDGQGLLRRLKREGLFGAIIGRTSDSHDRLLWNEKEKRFLEPPVSGEFQKVLELISQTK